MWMPIWCVQVCTKLLCESIFSGTPHLLSNMGAPVCANWSLLFSCVSPARSVDVLIGSSESQSIPMGYRGSLLDPG